MPMYYVRRVCWDVIEIDAKTPQQAAAIAFDHNQTTEADWQPDGTELDYVAIQNGPIVLEGPEEA